MRKASQQSSLTQTGKSTDLSKTCLDRVNITSWVNQFYHSLIDDSQRAVPDIPVFREKA